MRFVVSFLCMCVCLVASLFSVGLPTQDEILYSLVQPLPAWFDSYYLHYTGSQADIQQFPDGSSCRYARPSASLEEISFLDSDQALLGSCKVFSKTEGAVKRITSLAWANGSTHTFSYNQKGQITACTFTQTEPEKRVVKTVLQYSENVLTLSQDGDKTHYVASPDQACMVVKETKEGSSRIVVRNQGDEKQKVLFEYCDNGKSVDFHDLSGVTKRAWKRIHFDSKGRSFLEQRGIMAPCDQNEVLQEQITTSYYKDGSIKKSVLEDLQKKQTIESYYDTSGRVVQQKVNKNKICYAYEEVWDETRQLSLLKKTTIFPSGVCIVEFRDESNFCTYLEKRDCLGNRVFEEEAYRDSCSNSIQRTVTSYLKGIPSSRYIYTTYYSADHRVQAEEIATPDGERRLTRYEYTDQGLLIKKIKPNGSILFYEYKDDVLSRIFSPDGSVDYSIEYTRNREITRVYDHVHKIYLTREWSATHRILAELYGDTKICYEYASSGSKQKITLNDGSWIEYKLGNDGSEQIIRRSKNGTLLYKTALHPQKTKNDDVVQYDDLGQVASEEGAFSHSFCFNSLHELIEKDGVVCTRSPFGEVIADGLFTYCYDDNGNLIQKKNEGIDERYEYDALDRLVAIKRGGVVVASFQYDFFNRMRVETSYEETGSVKSIKHLVWDGDQEIGSVDSSGTIQELKVLSQGKKMSEVVSVELAGFFFSVQQDIRGSITALHRMHNGELFERYSYSAFGECMVDSLFPEEHVACKNPWRYCGKREQVGLVYFGMRHYMPVLQRWMTHDPLRYLDGYNSAAFVHNDPLHEVDIHGLMSHSLDVWHALSSPFRQMSSAFTKIIRSAVLGHQSLDWFLDVREHFEDIAFKVMKKNFMTLLGYSPDSTHVGIVGEKELSDKVKITSINGILNAKDDALHNSALISSTHAQSSVYYIYSKTQGFTGDLFRCLLIKAGITSPQAKTLASTWKELITDMGGIHGGGKIIHYAHSLGGADTLKALSLMDADEKKLIHVYTFGSAVLLDSHEAAAVTNYISTNDGVPIIADPYTYFHALHKGADGIRFLESEMQLPFADHFLQGETYRKVIEELGRQFQESYLLRRGDPPYLSEASLVSCEGKEVAQAEHSDDIQTLQHLIQEKQFHKLGVALAKMVGTSISLAELWQLPETQSCQELKNALCAARSIHHLDTEIPLGLSLAKLIQIALYIETNVLKSDMKKRSIWTTKKTGLPKEVEYDSASRYVFIHLSADSYGRIGEGAHKIALKSIIYHTAAPEVVARCVMKKRGNEQEMRYAQKFNGHTGLLEVRAIIPRGKVQGEGKYDIFFRFYSKGSLSRFLGSRAHRALSLRERLRTAHDLMSGLSSIHSMGYAHRDLHGGNHYLYTIFDATAQVYNLRAVIGDYGQLKPIKECRGIPLQYSRAVIPPEGWIYGGRSASEYQYGDVYAMGCVLYGICFNQLPPWVLKHCMGSHRGIRSHAHAQARIQRNLLTAIRDASQRQLAPLKVHRQRNEPVPVEEQFHELIFQMLDPSNKKRPSAIQVKKKIEALLRAA